MDLTELMKPGGGIKVTLSLRNLRRLVGSMPDERLGADALVGIVKEGTEEFLNEIRSVVAGMQRDRELYFAEMSGVIQKAIARQLQQMDSQTEESRRLVVGIAKDFHELVEVLTEDKQHLSNNTNKELYDLIVVMVDEVKKLVSERSASFGSEVSYIKTKDLRNFFGNIVKEKDTQAGRRYVAVIKDIVGGKTKELRTLTEELIQDMRNHSAEQVSTIVREMIDGQTKELCSLVEEMINGLQAPSGNCRATNNRDLVASPSSTEPLGGDRLLTNKDMLELLQISKRTLARYRQKGLVTYYLIDRKTYYKASEVQGFLNKKGKSET